MVRFKSMKRNSSDVTNIFEKALMDRYLQLELGPPDNSVKDAIQQAASEVTSVVKVVLNKNFNAERSRKKDLLKR